MFGKKKKIEKFRGLLVYAVLGILVGIVIGFLAGLLIGEIVHLIDDSGDMIPIAMTTFLGMGWGALIGGIFGGVFGYKE